VNSRIEDSSSLGISGDEKTPISSPRVPQSKYLKDIFPILWVLMSICLAQGILELGRVLEFEFTSSRMSALESIR
jgi:hypothetical protein